MQHKSVTMLKPPVLVALFLLGGILGCGSEPPLEPGVSAAGIGFLGADDDVSHAESIDLNVEPEGFSGRQPVAATWDEVASKSMEPLTKDSLTGSRYRLDFFETSLKTSAVITISERDPGIVDVELGPDGTHFETPVLLTIDYSGTANDPSSPDYHGNPVRLFWFNPGTKTWEVVPGTDDRKTKTYTAWLDHFSRYAMGDGANWNPFAKRIGRGAEIQWR